MSRLFEAKLYNYENILINPDHIESFRVSDPYLYVNTISGVEWKIKEVLRCPDIFRNELIKSFFPKSRYHIDVDKEEE